MTDDIVERLRKQSRRVAELYGDPEPPDEDMKPADQLWFTCQEAADEIERLKRALTEIRDLHQPMWVSAEAKAAGKKPWVCCWCGTADGSWPCDTRLTVDDALTENDR